MTPQQDSLSLTVVRRIDAACDRFEADWQAGKQPRIEAFLGAAAGEERTALLRALIEVEVELRRKQGAAPTVAEYERRFPQDQKLLTVLFQPGTQLLTPRTPSAVDTSVAKQAGLNTGSYHPEAKKPTLATTAEVSSPKIGRFEIIEVLGAGAFGKVYRARDPQLHREVALKVPLAGSLKPDELDRFLREARAAATIQHPNVCPVYEVGQEGETPFIVMAYIAGKSLATLLKERKQPMAPKQTALVVRKLAVALEAAHKKGIIHRDLKPANVMFDRDRKDVIVMDFGMARNLEAKDVLQTADGAIMGTPAYMSPEQAEGNVKAISPASDVFSLGVILYELLTGQRPFQGSMMAVMGQIMHIEPEPPSKVRSGVDPRLEAICKKAMAKKPAERYGSMKQLADALDEYLKGKETAQAGVSTAKDEAGETKGMAEIMAALAAERKADNAVAIEEAVRRAKTPTWVWLVACGFMALILIGGGIIFFFRTPTMTVMVNVDVDLTDKSLSFFLDDKPMPAEFFSKPVELDVGDHTLIVKRGSEIVRKYVFTVSKDAGPRIELKDQSPPPSPLKELAGGRKLEPRRNLEPGVWHPLIRSDADVVERQTAFPNGGSVRYQDGTLELNGSDPEYVGNVIAKDYIFRARVKKVSGSTLFMRVRHNEVRNNNGYAVWFNGTAWESIDGKKIPNSRLGSSFGMGKYPPGGGWKDLKVQWSQVKDQLRNECELALAVRGKRVTLYVDRKIVIDLEDSDCVEGSPALTVRNNTRALFRDMEVFILDGTNLNPDDVMRRSTPLPPFPAQGPKTPTDAEKAAGFQPLFNGKDLAGWSMLALKHTKQKNQSVWATDPERGVLFARGGDHQDLQTDRQYQNFILQLEWRFTPGGNTGPNGSGIVVRSPGLTTTGPLAGVDPRGIEIDLRSPTSQNGENGNMGTGCFFVYGTSLTNHRGTADGQTKRSLGTLAEPVIRYDGAWNTCEISCEGDRLKVWMNGVLVNEAWQAEMTRGRICLRSQNTAVEFRNLRIKELR